MCSFRSMLSSLDFPIVVFVIRITQNKLRGCATKNIWLTTVSTKTDPADLPHFQKTYNKFITEPNFMNAFCDKVVCALLIHHRNIFIIISGSDDCHDIHVLYKRMLTLDNCTSYMLQCIRTYCVSHKWEHVHVSCFVVTKLLSENQSSGFKGAHKQFHTSKCVSWSWGVICEKSYIKPFVAPEGVVWSLKNVL